MKKMISPLLTIKHGITCLIIALASICSLHLSAQSKQTTYLLPDGRVLPADKWDSLQQAWGKGRIIFRHNPEDDAKGIVHLVRQTDENEATDG